MNEFEFVFGRSSSLFSDEIQAHELALCSKISGSSFLILGGAGSIGQAVTKEICSRNPERVHVVDISENDLVELVRDIRSSFDSFTGDFQTFALDVASLSYDRFFYAQKPYDYILNFTAMKHVRSEKDPFSIVRMIETNVINVNKTALQARETGVKKYFCVSTDKATNPVNIMGATKLLMEKLLSIRGNELNISSARFANVAFSKGSLLWGFSERLKKRQPLAAPADISRYFMSHEEAGQLCLLSCLMGDNGDIFFPKLDKNEHLINLSKVAMKYITFSGYKPVLCASESEARELSEFKPDMGEWPLLLTESNTDGEKPYEEFFSGNDQVDHDRFMNIGVIKRSNQINSNELDLFMKRFAAFKAGSDWHKQQLVAILQETLPEFQHSNKGASLDHKM